MTITTKLIREPLVVFVRRGNVGISFHLGSLRVVKDISTSGRQGPEVNEASGASE